MLNLIDQLSYFLTRCVKRSGKIKASYAHHSALGSLFLFCLLSLGLSTDLYAKTKFNFQIQGISEPVLSNVQKSLNSLPRRLSDPPKPGELETLFEQVPDTVEKSLAPYGYFKPEVKMSKRPLGKKEWTVYIQIKPGIQTRVGKVHVAITGPGQKEKALQTALAEFPLHSGDPLDTGLYDQTKKKWSALATQAGYMSPNFTEHQISVDKATHIANIDLVLDTGPQYYFGQVHFDQNFYNEDFLKRFLGFKPGDPYSPQLLMNLQQNLNGTPYFSTVDVQPKQSQTSTDIPVEVNLTPSKGQFYNVGVGYGTDTGPRLTGTWEARHITDTGQYFKSFIQLSPVQSTVDARYIIPGKDPINDQYFIGGSLLQESPNTSKGQTESLSVGKQQLWKTWTATTSLSLQHDRYSLLGDPYRTDTMLLPSISLYKNSYDDIVFPRNGYSSNITIRGASKATYADTNFAQIEYSPKAILSPFSFSRIILRSDLGYSAVSDPATIPLSLQYFAGGSDSIRGYDYEELGPGRYLFVGSAEYQQNVYKNWWGTAFMDAGNAVNDLKNPEDHLVGEDQPHVDLAELLKKSVGLGVMYASPVGPIELTIAKPLGDNGNGLSFQFRMGGNL